MRSSGVIHKRKGLLPLVEKVRPMSESHREFVLADSFSYLNKGDAGIIMGMLEDLSHRFDQPRFTLVTETPEIDDQRYADIETMDSPYRRVYRVDSTVEKILWFGFTVVTLCWGLFYRISDGRVPCPGPLAIVEVYGSADAVLVSGGDKYYDYDDGFKRAIDGLPKIFETVLAIIVGTKLMIYAHSGGPFENRYRRKLLEWMCKNSQVITAREPISETYFASLDPKVQLTADAAFLAPDGSEDSARAELTEHGIDPTKPLVGLTARRWHFPESNEDMEQYREGIKAVATEFREEGYQVALLPQVIGPYTDDRVVSREIARGFDEVAVLEEDYDVPLLREIIGQCDVFVGTRMHSNIFALSKSVPTVAIAYRHKTNGIMQMFGLENHVVEIDRVQTDLPEAVDEILANKERVAEIIESELPNIQDQARKNSEYAKEMIQGL